MELLLGCAVILLMVVVILLSILVYKVGEGFRVLFNHLDSISSGISEISDHLTPDDHYEPEP
jgi:hypothetical protein